MVTDTQTDCLDQAPCPQLTSKVLPEPTLQQGPCQPKSALCLQSKLHVSCQRGSSPSSMARPPTLLQHETVQQATAGSPVTVPCGLHVEHTQYESPSLVSWFADKTHLQARDLECRLRAPALSCILHSNPHAGLDPWWRLTALTLLAGGDRALARDQHSSRLHGGSFCHQPTCADPAAAGAQQGRFRYCCCHELGLHLPFDSMQQFLQEKGLTTNRSLLGLSLQLLPQTLCTCSTCSSPFWAQTSQPPII